MFWGHLQSLHGFSGAQGGLQPRTPIEGRGGHGRGGREGGVRETWGEMGVRCGAVLPPAPPYQTLTAPLAPQLCPPHCPLNPPCHKLRLSSAPKSLLPPKPLCNQHLKSVPPKKPSKSDPPDSTNPFNSILTPQIPPSPSPWRVHSHVTSSRSLSKLLNPLTAPQIPSRPHKILSQPPKSHPAPHPGH